MDSGIISFEMSNPPKSQLRYALVNGVRLLIDDAARQQHGFCPVCGSEMVARKGEIRTAHWAHLDKDRCDDWYESKGPWHRYWQDKFPREWQEVPLERNGEKHIADIYRPDKQIVLEAQYSALSDSDISRRENFYGRLIWLANMSRIKSETELEEKIRKGERREISGHTFFRFDHDILERRQRWLYCKRPVVMDFGGTFESPESDGPLYYVFPETEKFACHFCAELTRDEFVSTLLSSSVADFFNGLTKGKNQWAKEVEQIRAQRQKEWERQIRQQEEESRKRQESFLQDIHRMAMAYVADADVFRHAVHFVSRRSPVPPRCALTFGWVEAMLIMQGQLVHECVPTPAFDFAPYGRVAIHFASSYSHGQFKLDIDKARDELGADVSDFSYEALEQYRGMIAGAVDYVTRKDGSCVVFTFRNMYQFWEPQRKGWCQKPSGTCLWKLQDRISDYIANVDPFSKSGFF